MPGVQSPSTSFPAHVERLVQVGLGEVERVSSAGSNRWTISPCPDIPLIATWSLFTRRPSVKVPPYIARPGVGSVRHRGGSPK